MHKNNLYPTKSIYLGTIETIEDDTKVEKIIAFKKKTDKLTGNVNYIPLDSKIGYYYLRKAMPISLYLRESDKKALLTAIKVNEVLRDVKEKGIKIDIPSVVNSKEEKEEILQETKPATYYDISNVKTEEPKIMKYKATSDRKIG